MQKAEYRYYEISQDLPVMALSGKKWEYLFVDVEEILKRGFVNVPEKYIYVEQNLSKKISVLENAGSTKAAALMQMIIEEIQLRQANYRYTVSTLAFNLVLFFDRLDNEILLRSRDRKIKEANQKVEEEKQKAEEANQKAEKEKKKAEEANQRAEKANNEIDSILDETKESIIKYIKMQFHEDISDFISTFSKQQIRNLQKHLYDFEEFEELKNYFQKPKGLSRKVCK